MFDLLVLTSTSTVQLPTAEAGWQLGLVLNGSRYRHAKWSVRMQVLDKEDATPCKLRFSRARLNDCESLGSYRVSNFWFVWLPGSSRVLALTGS
jgi:hypothetical protein